jgi:membrane protease YdiL (CAAX protease family)
MIQHINLKIFTVYIGMLILLIAAQAIYIQLSDIQSLADPELIRINTISNLFYYGGMLLIFVVWFKKYWTLQVQAVKDNLSSSISLIIGGFGAMIGVMIIAGLIMQALGITDTSQNQEQLNMILEGSLFDKVSLVVFAVILAPIVEELVFRKAVFGVLGNGKKVHPVLVIILSSLIFGLIHVLGDDLLQITTYAMLGAVLGSLFYISKGKIIIPIAVHMAFNLFVTITMFVTIEHR